MPFLKLEAFSGISPRTGPALLQPNQAQVASNVKIQSGELRPWRKPVFAYTTGNSNVQTIYQLEKTSTGATAWLEWTTDVNVVPGPVADVTDDRVYYTDGVGPKKTNWALATTSGTGVKPFPNAYYQMGVPNPTTGPTLVKSGGSGTVHEDRVYVYTYVNTFGAVLEESGPSPATAISTVEPNATRCDWHFCRQYLIRQLGRYPSFPVLHPAACHVARLGFNAKRHFGGVYREPSVVLRAIPASRLAKWLHDDCWVSDCRAWRVWPNAGCMYKTAPVFDYRFHAWGYDARESAIV